MAIKKVELLTVDANQDTLYPKTESDIVVHGNSTVKIVLDGKVDKTQATTTPTPNTIVERTGTANINIGNGVFFNDVAGAGGYLGGIGIGSGDTNGVPFTDQPIHTKSDNTKAQIWTSETAPIDENATNNTIAKRNNNGQLNAKAYKLIDTNGNYKGALDCSAAPMVGDPIWWNNVTNRNSTIWNEENLPIERGGWTPQVKCSNGGEATYAVDGQSGTYIRIGSMVTVYGNINIASKGNMTGDFQVHGLPFVPRGSACGVSIGMLTNLAKPSYTDTHAMIFATNPFIRFNACTNNSTTGGITWLNVNHVGNNVSLVFSATFRMD